GVFLMTMIATIPKKEKSTISIKCLLNACQTEMEPPFFVTTLSPKISFPRVCPVIDSMTGNQITQAIRTHQPFGSLLKVYPPSSLGTPYVVRSQTKKPK